MAQGGSHVGPDVAEKVRTACAVGAGGWSGSSFKLPLPCRGLRFIQILLQSLADGEKDENNPNLIRVNVVKAYEQALKRYHGWIVQKVFNVSKRLRLSFGFRGEQLQVLGVYSSFACVVCCRRCCLQLRTDPASSRPCPKERT